MNNRDIDNKPYWYVVARTEGDVERHVGEWVSFPFRKESFTSEVIASWGIKGKISYLYVCGEWEKFLYEVEMKKKALRMISEWKSELETGDVTQ